MILLFNHMEKKARLKLPKVLSDIHYFFLPFFSNPFREDKAANTCYRDLWNDGTGKPDGKEKNYHRDSGEAMQNDRNRWEQYWGKVHPFSIMLTNYLAGYLRRKAILLEFNESGGLRKA